MQTYCWNCEKQTKMENLLESKRIKLFIRGNCEVCGAITSKTIARKLEINK